MADLKFPCPSCHQSIICDELWCGQEIQCPSCQAQLVVPSQQAPEPSSLVPKPPPAGASKLSIGKQHQSAPAAPPPGGQRFAPGAKKPVGKKTKSKDAVLKVVKVGVALIVLGAAGYFGYDWWTKKKAKAEAEAIAAAKAITDAQKTANESAAANKPLPVVPPAWTLDVDTAKIPEGQANGSLAGTNFVVESASIIRSATSQVLDLRQGTGPTPERQIMIYLRLSPGETVAGHTKTVSQDMKGAGVPQILKRWKGPTGALQQKFFSTGYAMKLELGQTNENTIPGKIFLALPDPEQSVVAGLFKIQPPSTDPAAAQPVTVQPTTPSGPSPDRAAFERRYGPQKR